MIADNEWHLYQWNLVDDARWNNFSNGNGNIDNYLVPNGTVTIDSIFFNGSGNAKIYLDTLSHNYNGLLSEANVAGDFNGDGHVDYDDYTTWQRSFAENIGPGLGADANGDGTIDAGDYVMWRKLMAAAAVARARLQRAAIWCPSQRA